MFLLTTYLFNHTELPLECDKCQFSCMPLREMLDHRKEKHRLWECSRCGDSFINQQSFDEHGRGSRKWNYNCVEHPFVSTYVRTSHCIGNIPCFHFFVWGDDPRKVCMDLWLNPPVCFHFFHCGVRVRCPGGWPRLLVFLYFTKLWSNLSFDMYTSTLYF